MCKVCQIIIFIFAVCFRAAHLLASSFNFQGRVKKLFYVLTDDKVGSGPRLKPGVLSKGPVTVQDHVQPMETDHDNPEAAQPSEQSTSKADAPGLSLAAKLALKRKSDQVGPAQGHSQQKVQRQ